jgi:hypothetical protein
MYWCYIATTGGKADSTRILIFLVYVLWKKDWRKIWRKEAGNFGGI